MRRTLRNLFQPPHFAMRCRGRARLSVPVLILTSQTSYSCIHPNVPRLPVLILIQHPQTSCSHNHPNISYAQPQTPAPAQRPLPLGMSRGPGHQTSFSPFLITSSSSERSDLKQNEVQDHGLGMFIKCLNLMEIQIITLEP